MKNVLRIDMTFIFDASEDDAVWSGSREFEKSQKKVVQALGGVEELLSKEIVSDNHARYTVLVSRKEKTPVVEGPAETKKAMEVPKKKVQRMKKGGKPLPKVETKKIKFSMKKGRRLVQKKRGKPKIGGRT